MDLSDTKIGFIGGGNMAKAIFEGILDKGLVKQSQIMVSSPSKETISGWKAYSVEVTHSNDDVIRFADIIFLTFKPYQLDKALQHTYNRESTSKLFVSVLAGTESQAIYEKLVLCVQPNPRLIRVMPNTPVRVCEGCTAIAPHSSATNADVELVNKIFCAVGKCEMVSESLIPAVTGLTGSGPAYVFMIIEALSDGAVKLGLPRELATNFAAQTVMGSAKTVLETKTHPALLREEVCSAGGTTIYGIHELEKGQLRATLMSAVETAARRAQELSKK